MRQAYDSGIILSKGGVKMIETEFLEENKKIINDLRKIPRLAPFEDADLAALCALQGFCRSAGRAVKNCQ